MTGTLSEVMLETWKNPDPNRVLGKGIIVDLVFGCPHLYHGIDRRLGEGQLWPMILSRANKRYIHSLSRLVIVSDKEGAHGSC